MSAQGGDRDKKLFSDREATPDSFPRAQPEDVHDLLRLERDGTAVDSVVVDQILVELARKRPEILWAVLDSDVSPEVAERLGEHLALGVTGVSEADSRVLDALPPRPTQLVYEDGRLVHEPRPVPEDLSQRERLLLHIADHGTDRVQTEILREQGTVRGDGTDVVTARHGIPRLTDQQRERIADVQDPAPRAARIDHGEPQLRSLRSSDGTLLDPGALLEPGARPGPAYSGLKGVEALVNKADDAFVGLVADAAGGSRQAMEQLAALAPYLDASMKAIVDVATPDLVPLETEVEGPSWSERAAALADEAVGELMIDAVHPDPRTRANAITMLRQVEANLEASQAGPVGEILAAAPEPLKVDLEDLFGIDSDGESDVDVLREPGGPPPAPAVAYEPEELPGDREVGGRRSGRFAAIGFDELAAASAEVGAHREAKFVEAGDLNPNATAEAEAEGIDFG